MNTVPIGELVSKVEKLDPRLDFGDGTFNYIDIGAVSQDTKRVEAPQVIPCEEAPSRARQVVKKNDVLVSTVRPNLNAVAQVPAELDGTIASTGFSVLRPDPKKLEPSYLYHWVQTNVFVSKMMLQATGQSYPAVSDKIVKSSTIPLPPLEEQKRIAGILDQADTLRRLRTRALDKLNTLGQAVFHEMFGDPKNNVHDFPETTLENLCQVISDCLHKTPEHTEGRMGHPSVRSSDLQSGFIDLSSTKHVSAETYADRIQRHRPVAGDVVYCREGARYGNCGMVPPNTELCLGQRTMLFQAKSGSVTPEYLWSVISSDELKKQADMTVGGAASPHVNIRDIRKFTCLLPPYQLQEQFSQKIEMVLGMRNCAIDHLRKTDTLFASLQHRAFRGEF